MFANKNNRTGFSTRKYTNNLSNRAKESYNVVSDKYNKTSTFEKVVLFLVLLALMYGVYSYFFKNHQETKLIDVHDASDKLVISQSKLPSFTMTDYSISIWYYINDWNKAYGKDKYILGKYSEDPQTKELRPVPSIRLDSFTNNVKVAVSYANPSSSSKDKVKVHECIVNSVPLQRWTNIIISMNNRLLDVYIDGKLRRTCPLPGVPIGNAASDMYLAGSPNDDDTGFSGFLSDLKIYTYAMAPREAYNIYKSGHSGSGVGSLMNKYKLKMSIIEDQQEVNSLTFP